MEHNEKELIESMISLLKETIAKEKQLDEVFGGKSNVYKDIIDSLEQALFKRFELDYGWDGEDDGNYKEGLFSYVISGKITIWQLLELKEAIHHLWMQYKDEEIDIETYHAEEQRLEASYGIY